MSNNIKSFSEAGEKELMTLWLSYKTVETLNKEIEAYSTL